MQGAAESRENFVCLEPELKMGTPLIHRIYCSALVAFFFFFFLAIPLFLLKQIQCGPLQCLIHLIYSYSLSSFRHLASIHTERSCLALCWGSPSFISLSELSGACCPGTDSIRDLVINGSMKAPPPFFPGGPPVIDSSHFPKHIACVVIQLLEA